MADPTCQPGLDIGPGHPPGCEFGLEPFDASSHSPDRRLTNKNVRGPDPIPNEGDACRHRPDTEFASVQYKAPGAKIFYYGRCQSAQVGAVITEHQEIVTISEIGSKAANTRNVMVQPGEHPVCEPLAGKVADREALASFRWREKVVAGKPLHDRLLRVGAIDNKVHKSQGSGVLDEPHESCFHNFVVNAREEFLNVAFEHIFVPMHERLKAAHCQMRASRLSACVAIRVEMSFQYRLQDIHKGMMHNTVAIGSN